MTKMTPEVMEDLSGPLTSNPFSDRSKLRLPPGAVYKEEWEAITVRSIMKMLVARFTWTGLPEKMPVFYMEEMLVRHGHALIFEDPNVGYLVGTGSKSGFNHYEEALEYNVISPTYQKRFNLMTDKAVMVKNDSESMPDLYIVRKYVKTLAEIKMTKAINLNTLKTPYIITANQKTKSSLIKQLDQIEQGETRIIVDPELSKTGQSIGVFQTPTPYNLDKLQAEYIANRQEMLEMLGINTNPQILKKERLTSAESQSNNQEVGLHLLTHFIERTHAAEKASELLNREITVEMSDLNDVTNFIHGSNSSRLHDGTLSGVDKS